MRLFLVRHAEAAPGDPDDLRPLTPAGREAARALGEKLAAERLDAVLSSPLLRARETAEQIARAAGIEPEEAFGGHLEPGTNVFTFAIVTIGVMSDAVDFNHLDDKAYR